MQRDMDLIRKILLKIEASRPFEKIKNLQVDDIYDLTWVACHCEMLFEAGFIKEYYASTCELHGVNWFYVRDLTWEGQNFIETIRQDTIWNKTKKAIKEKGLPLLVSTISSIATAFITAAAEGVANSIIKNGGTPT